MRSKLPYLALGFILCLTGCRTTRVADPLTNRFGGNDPDMQMEFWHNLADRPITCNDEAFHGLLLYLDGDDPTTTYDERIELMKRRRMLPWRFKEGPDQALQRGTLAVAITRSLEIKGGLVMRITGPTPRYATRELQYMGLYPPSSPNQTFSGSEFLGIMGKIEDYQLGDTADQPAGVMSAQEIGPEVPDSRQQAPPPNVENSDVPADT